jgi:hypothetical protein
MKKLIEFKLADDSSIFIEAEDTETQARQRVGRGGENETEAATNRFENAIQQIKPAAEAVLQTFQEMNTPNEIALEFGIKFNANAGAIFASAGSEATFKVVLKWVNKK